MNKQEKDLEKCHNELFEELLTAILFLNHNGVPIDNIRKMILIIVDRVFITYEEQKIRERFKDIIRKQ